MNIQNIINPFLQLREKGVRDPFYVRLVDSATKTVAWLWRNSSATQQLSAGETFSLTIEKGGKIEITWIPMFEAKTQGDRYDVHYAHWFFSQRPRISGGSHISLDNFQCGAADWSLQADDFYIVRCGSYRRWDGRRVWRQPSDEAIDWAGDPDRFLVSDAVRGEVLRRLAVSEPTGERYTIRRIFRGDFHRNEQVQARQLQPAC